MCATKQPERALFQRLTALWQDRGEPGIREIQKLVAEQTPWALGRATIDLVLQGTDVPRWEQLEPVVLALGGDAAEFNRLWIAACETNVEGLPRGEDMQQELAVTPARAEQGFDLRLAYPAWITCDLCHGPGIRDDLPCLECGGKGTVPDLRRITVRIPSGVTDGQRVRCVGLGNAGPHGGTPGDLYLLVSVTDANASQVNDFSGSAGNVVQASFIGEVHFGAPGMSPMQIIGVAGVTLVGALVIGSYVYSKGRKSAQPLPILLQPAPQPTAFNVYHHHHYYWA